MTTQVQLHILSGSKRAGELCQLVESLYRAGRTVIVWVADNGRRQALDDFLWTFEKLSFVPHVVWSEGLGEVEEAIVLVGEPVNPIGAEHLVIADDLPPESWIRTFTVVHDLVASGPDGADRSAFWDQFKADNG